jgi:hypothetical protein
MNKTTARSKPGRHRLTASMPEAVPESASAFHGTVGGKKLTIWARSESDSGLFWFKS